MTRAPFETEPPEDYLERLATSAAGRAYKSVALEQLALEEGQTVVDLGCGPGTDLARFAEAVGPTGRVVGVDSDAGAELRVAVLATAYPWIEFRCGDVQALDLPDRSVDRVNTDRVLQHVREPHVVVEEALRVLRPHGRAVFAEPDHDTLVIDHPEPRLLVAYRAFVAQRVVRNADIGRRLPALAEQAGFGAVRTVAVTHVYRNVAEADEILGLGRVTAAAVDAGFLQPEEGDRWLDHLTTEPFFASATVFVTVAEA